MKFKADQTTQKLRGGYYTPQHLADYVAKWVLSINPQSILEPSCGDGVFIQAIANNNAINSLQMSCFELLDTEVEKAQNLAKKLGYANCNVTEGDFLVWANKQLAENKKIFDGVVGNPPFIRYQFLEKSFQAETETVFKTLGLKFTKHTNAWVPFILASLSLLKDGGRLGMVIPSEIINVMHSQSLRTFMGKICSKIVIIDPKEIWFEDTLQGAVILLAEKKKNKESSTKGVGIVSVEGLEFLETDPNEIFESIIGINGKTVDGKWTKAVLSKEELDLIEKIVSHENVYLFKDIAEVDVGIVTGANEFFLVNDETVNEFNLHKYAYPMFGRSQHCKGILYDENQHEENIKLGLPTNFIHMTEVYDKLSSGAQQYVKLGEEKEYQTRYKCRIRKPWYTVPSVYSRSVGMLKRSHGAPRLILNTLGAYTTDTAYRVTSTKADPANLVCSFLNPITAIFAELEGRFYGGGVLELVPSEIEKLYVPLVEGLEHNIEEINQLVKEGDLDTVIKKQGERIFTCLGFSKEDNDRLMNIWEKLKDRRQRN
ncbi:N-6 DNA methylase [Acinetobacter baumannii]|nr:N-6 DNA methylase [Acinetobacter baumannii]